MPRVQAALATKVTLDPERPEYHRASLTWSLERGEFVAASTGRQISSRLPSFRGAAALLELPRGTGTLEAGTIVSALLLGELGASIQSHATLPEVPKAASLVSF
jgi:molybdopterin biosynthesis enzyme